MSSKAIIGWIIVILVIVGGWWWYSSSQSMSGSPTSTTSLYGDQNTAATTTPAAPSTLSASQSASLGNYLVATNGMTLYHFTKDTVGVSNCTGSCATMWPPYTVPSGTTPTADSGISGTLSTITRADGTTQVTYNGEPLYYWYKDVNPGDTNGQGVGGVWYVVMP